MDDKNADSTAENAAESADENKLKETAAGRLARDKAAHKMEQAPGERGGRGGPEPTRYGDWEKKGIISDF